MRIALKGGGVIVALCAAMGLAACDRGAAPDGGEGSAAAQAFKRKDVILYLPDREMVHRVEVSDLSPYLKAVETAVDEAAEAAPVQVGVSGVLLVMVKPDGRSRVWMVTGEPAPATEASQAVIAAAEAVETPPVRNGPILVGLAFEGWGGGAAPGGNTAPIPQEWYAHFPPQGGALDDAMMARIWPD